MSLTPLEAFIRQYVRTALWSSCDEDGDPLDEAYGEENIAPAALEEMTGDCEAFVAEVAPLLERVASEYRAGILAAAYDGAGHDFWLTRNGHGAGFWDRGFGDLGEELTRAAKVYGSSDLYVGDDGLLYVS